MDALDLTTGERLLNLKTLVKGSRRKAFAPQRRHLAVGEDNKEEYRSQEQDEKLPPEISKDENLEKSEIAILENHASSPKSDTCDVNLEKSVTEKETSRHAPNSIDSPHSIKDDGNILLEREARPRNHLLAYTQGHKYLFNMNNNSNGIPSESISDGSAGDQEDGQPSYKSGSAPGEFSHSLLFPFSGPVDELMQQRLRRYLDDVQPAEAPGIPERTKKQNRWAFNVWREWARKRNMLEDSFTGLYKGVPLDVGQANEEELDYWLCKFVMEIRRKDGNPYPPHTLMQIVMGIQRYLRQQAGKPSICILDRSNPIYSHFRSVLDFRIKELASNGAVAMKSISRSNFLGGTDAKLNTHAKEEFPTFANKFNKTKKEQWKNGVMGTDSAHALLNAVFYHNHKTFDIQYIDDHWNLRAENFSIHFENESEGQKYLEFTPSVTSMMVATGKGNGVQVTPRRIESDPHSDQSIFNIYEKYLSLIPKHGPFYRHPVDPTIVDRSIKFSDQWVGKNRLRAMLKHLIDTGNGFARQRSIFLTGNDSGNLAFNGFPSPLIQLPRKGSDPSSHLHEKLGVIKPLPTNNPNNISGNKHQYSPSIPENGSAPPSPKRSRIHITQAMTKPLGRHISPRITFDGEISEATESAVANDILEITVPQSIKSVTILKGSRRITIQLD